MNLLILKEHDRISDHEFSVSGDRQNHINQVLKLEPGDQIKAGIVNGPVGLAQIERSDPQRLILTFVPADQQPPLPSPCIDLICALPRPQTVKKILNLAGTWGLRKLDFIRANRVEKSFYHSPLLEADKMRPFLIDGLSQGKQTRLPVVEIHQRFKPFFEHRFSTGDEVSKPADRLKLLPHPEAETDLSHHFETDSRQIVIAIGPEGGWVDFEIDFMTELGFRTVRLARPVLRVESAALAALAQIELLSLSRKS
ncbi:MAG: RsmE family RNA methyltransferase [bacterium]|nr:RsmE family RNA methyltransferase [bacterium]